MHALPGDCSVVRSENKDFAAAGTTGDDHAFTHAELHFAWREIGNADDESPHELFRVVSSFDTSKDLPVLAAAKTELELEQLARIFDVRGFDNPGDAQVNLQEVVKAAFLSERLSSQGGRQSRSRCR